MAFARTVGNWDVYYRSQISSLFLPSNKDRLRRVLEHESSIDKHNLSVVPRLVVLWLVRYGELRHLELLLATAESISDELVTILCDLVEAECSSMEPTERCRSLRQRALRDQRDNPRICRVARPRVRRGQRCSMRPFAQKMLPHWVDYFRRDDASGKAIAVLANVSDSRSLRYLEELVVESGSPATYIAAMQFIGWKLVQRGDVAQGTRILARCVDLSSNVDPIQMSDRQRQLPVDHLLTFQALERFIALVESGEIDLNGKTMSRFVA